MTRGLSAAFKNIVTGEVQSSANLLDIYLDARVVRLTDVAVPLPAPYAAYIPFPFTYTAPKQGKEIGQITLTASSRIMVDDGGPLVPISRWIVEHGLVDHVVIIRNVEADLLNEPMTLFRGRVANVPGDVGAQKLSIMVRSEIDFSGETFPACYPTRHCNLEFKGPKCLYAGADASCGRQWADCLAKANTAHFRGL